MTTTDRDARIDLKRAAQLHARAQAGNTTAARERDEIIADLVAAGVGITLDDVDRWAFPSPTKADPAANRAMDNTDARRLVDEAVTLHARANGTTNRFAAERDDLLADLAAAGARITLADIHHFAFPTQPRP